MKIFTVYNAVSGRILRTGNCQDETFAAQAMSSGEAIGEFSGAWATEYVVSGQLQPRPSSSITLSKSGSVVTLSGVHAGVQPEIVGNAGINKLDATTDGSPITAALASGTYTVTVEQFPEIQFYQQITI